MAECVGDFRKIDIEWCTVHDCPAHVCTIRQLEADILRLLVVDECACRVEWVNNPNSLTVVGKPGRWTPILCPRHSEAHVQRLLAVVEAARKVKRFVPPELRDALDALTQELT